MLTLLDVLVFPVVVVVVLMLSREPVMETVVERGAGMREACESTSWSRCDWNGAMYERSSMLEVSLDPVIDGWWS